MSMKLTRRQFVKGGDMEPSIPHDYPKNETIHRYSARMAPMCFLIASVEFVIDGSHSYFDAFRGNTLVHSLFREITRALLSH